MTDERSERLRQRFERRQRRVDDLDGSDAAWACRIGGCTYTGETVEDVIEHQALNHPPHQCKVCHGEFPDGFVAIYHVFEEHGRTEYVKAYDASSADVRWREQVKASIESAIDVNEFLKQLNRPERSHAP